MTALRPGRLLLAGLLVIVALAAGAAPAPADGIPTRIGFTWEMNPRYGLDHDGDGRIEIENTYEDVNSRATRCEPDCPLQRFRVSLHATPDPANYGLSPDLVSYEWRVTGPAGSGTYFRGSPELNLRLPEGLHDIDLRIEVRVIWGTITLRRRGTIEVDDLLVVAIGDSYPSGEGSPEIPLDGDEPAAWADASDPAIEEQHALAHRSTVGWPAQVAMALEVADRHSSVSFVDLAAASARIGSGILRAHPFLALPPQLDQLESIVGDRAIDVLLIQVGGNDIGFSQVIRALVDADPLLDPICYETMLDNARLSLHDGRWDRDVTLGYDPPFGIACRPTGGIRAALPGLDGLDAEFDALGARLAPLPIERVLIVEYPDPTGSRASGETCREIVGDTTPPLGFHEVDQQEQEWGRDLVLGPLNDTIARAADRHGWELVSGVASAFLVGHGYCADWPDYGYPREYLEAPSLFRDPLDHPSGWYRVPGRYGGVLLLNRGGVSWYRTASQSAALQGPAPRFLTSGTLHPNELGHAAISRLVLATLATD